MHNKIFKEEVFQMAANIINYYGGGNTAKGQINFYDSIFGSVRDLYVIKNAPQIIKTSFIKAIAQAYLLREHEIELINSYMHNEYVEGVIIPDAQVAFADGNPIYGARIGQVNRGKEFIDLSGVMQEDELLEMSGEIETLDNKMKKEFKKAQEAFDFSLKIHDELNKIYFENMDEGKESDLALNIIDKIFKDKSSSKESKVYHRFFWVITPEGSKDFIPDLTKNIEKRFFIKGRPGTGKSAILKKILKEGQNRGFDLEAYHSGLDPDDIDMVVIRELSICIFASTNPYEYFLEKETDEILDPYNEFPDNWAQEKYKDKISELTEIYEEKLIEGKKYLTEGKKYMLQIEGIYLHSLDKEKLKNLQRGLGTLIELYVR